MNVLEAAQNLIHKILRVLVRQRLRRGNDSESQTENDIRVWGGEKMSLKMLRHYLSFFRSDAADALVEVSVEELRHEINIFKCLLGLWPQNVAKRNNVLVVEVAQEFDLAQRALAFDDIGEC